MTIYGDTFVEASPPVNLESHTATGPNGGWSWTKNGSITGGAQIQTSGQLASNTSDSTGDLYYANVGVTDHYAQFVPLAAAPSFGAVVRGVDASNFISVRWSSGALQLWKRVSGTLTQIDAYTYTYSAGDVVKITVAGTAVSLYLNGTLILGPYTVSDGVFTGVTNVGLAVRNAVGDGWIASWEGGALGSPFIFQPFAI